MTWTLRSVSSHHCRYWPAFLESAGQPSPTRIQVHPYLTVNGKKLSKSLGTAIDPVELVDAYGDDALRWWFARDVGEVADTDFTIARLIDRANEDLANALANTANRIATLVDCALGGRIADDQEALLPTEIAQLDEAIAATLSDFRPRDAARQILEAVAALNADLTVTEPWRVARDPDQRDRLEQLLTRQLKAARAIAAAATPIVPHLSAQLLHQLGEGLETLPEPRPTFSRLG